MHSFTHFNRLVVLAINLINGKVVQSFTPSGVLLKNNKQTVINIPSTRIIQPVDILKKRCLDQHLSAKEGESSKVDNDDVLEFVEASDGEALQSLFEKQCDKDGLMTKKSLVSIPLIDDLLVR